MSLPKDKYPCICGHVKGDHLRSGPNATGWDWVCRRCYNYNFNIPATQCYHNFKLDNLRYLERLSE